MAASILVSPWAASRSLELPLRLGNCAELGRRGGAFPSQGAAQIWGRAFSSYSSPPFVTFLGPGRSRPSVENRSNSTWRVLSRKGSRVWDQESSREISVRCGGDNKTISSNNLEKSPVCLSDWEKSGSKRSKAGDTGGAFGSQSAPTKSINVGVLLGGVLLALGFVGLRFCRPAYAENVVAPPTTVSAPVDANREEKVSEPKSSETDAQKSDDVAVPVEKTDAKDQSEAKGSGEGEEFEPPFGEGSDLTNDPAEVLLRSYLEIHPEDMKALQALLFLRLKKGEVNAAGPIVQKLIELEPENIEWKYIRAQVDEYAGDLDQARRGFEEILQSMPLSARAWQGLAVIMHKTGEDEEAVEKIMAAVNTAVDGGQSKEALNLRMLLGQLHTMQGNLEKAMELYKIVVDEDPEDYRPYLCQGLVYSIIGDEKEAEKYFRRYRKLCPKDFPQRGFLDELMLKAKTESGKLSKSKKEEEEFKKKGKKVPKPLRQPLASGGSFPSRDNQNGT